MPDVPRPREPDELCIATLRALAIDMVENAGSGHPGAPMGMAPMAYVVWSRFLRHAPRQPDWPDRDRFVLSAGHASALLYSLLHLTGYDISLSDLRAFRQSGSKTPGHPERGVTPGVEVTTGPLGQGFAAAVGLAIAERRLAREYNRPGLEIVDHATWVVVSDGDLQEGIAAEAASLAGHLQLGRLVVLYDDNGIQLDGPTALASSEDVPARFAAYGWQTLSVDDGNDVAEIAAAIEAAIGDPRPSLIAVRTHLGFGSPGKQDTNGAHGAPLGAGETRLAKRAYGLDPEASFVVPPEVRAAFGSAGDRGEALVAVWQERRARHRAAYPSVAVEFERRLAGTLPQDWQASLPAAEAVRDRSTRAAGHVALNALATTLPELLGGSADLAMSNMSDVEDGGDYGPDGSGRNLRFGVREHAMAAVANGLAANGGFIPYVATYLIFSDYLRGALRLAALSKLHAIYLFTHDSIAVGEDGPTHQPVEHLAALRAIPNLWVVRPGDPNEAVAAWALAVERRDGPVALVLSRQSLPTLAGTDELAHAGLPRGAYVLRPAHGEADGRPPEAILLATGSELSLAVTSAESLEAEGVDVRVVSMPCWERFGAQDRAYRCEVLPPAVVHRVAIEAGVGMGWERWVGDHGAILGIEAFGASAPARVLFDRFGFTPHRVAAVVRELLHPEADRDATRDSLLAS